MDGSDWQQSRGEVVIIELVNQQEAAVAPESGPVIGAALIRFRPGSRSSTTSRVALHRARWHGSWIRRAVSGYRRSAQLSASRRGAARGSYETVTLSRVPRGWHVPAGSFEIVATVGGGLSAGCGRGGVPTCGLTFGAICGSMQKSTAQKTTDLALAS